MQGVGGWVRAGCEGAGHVGGMHAGMYEVGGVAECMWVECMKGTVWLDQPHLCILQVLFPLLLLVLLARMVALILHERKRFLI